MGPAATTSALMWVYFLKFSTKLSASFLQLALYAALSSQVFSGISSSEGTPSMLVGTCTPNVGSVTNSLLSMSPVRAAVTMARV